MSSEKLLRKLSTSQLSKNGSTKSLAQLPMQLTANWNVSSNASLRLETTLLSTSFSISVLFLDADAINQHSLITIQ